MPAAKTLTPEQRTLRARIAAYTRWAHEDPRPTAERAQAGLREKFRRQVREEFPDLDEAELERRAEAAYRAHFTWLSYRASRARAARERGGRGA